MTDGLCTACSKGKAKTVVNVATSKFLNAKGLAQLPQKDDIGPDDSLSMIGVKKRQREPMEEKLFHFPQDVPRDDYSSESEESKHDYPQKRQKFTEAWSISTVPIKMDCIGQLVVSHADAGDVLSTIGEKR